MELTGLSLIDIAVLAAYLMLLISIGFFYVQKKQSANAAEELFLSGRSLPWYKIGLSIFSTNVSPMMLVGYCGIAYSTGMVGSLFEWLAWPFLLLLSIVFIPHYLTNRISTMPEFLMRRYGKRSHLFMSYYTLFSTLVIWVSFVLFTGGIVIAQITGIPFWLAAVGVAGLALSYTVKGGLGAIVKTGMLQSVIIITVSVILCYLGLKKVGGIEQLITRTPSEYWTIFRPVNDEVYPWHAMLLGYPVIGIWYWCTDQTIVQRVLAAKSIDHGQRGAWLVALLKVVMPFIFIVPGIMCLLLFPQLQKADHAYITMVTTVLPAGIVGLALGALIAALVNDVAMGLSAFSTVFSLDIYARKIKKDATPAEVSSIGKKMIVLAAIVAVLVAILISFSDKGLFNLSQAVGVFLAPPLSTVFLLGVFWKGATAKAAELTLYLGSFICLTIGILHVTDYPYKGFWPHYMLMAFYMMMALVVFMTLVSLLTKPSADQNLTSLKESYVQSNAGVRKSVIALWLLVVLLMSVIYYVFR